MESYRTLREGAEATGEFEDRRSRFIAQLVHAASEKDAAAHVAAVRARHYDARHNVPAWILADGTERASDDGEPQRTSGLPTLEVLRGAGLKDVCCVTTRYFGGTLLGPGGLVRAYTAAAQAAVAAAGDADLIVEMTSVVPIALDVTYAQYDQVRDVVERTGGKVADTAFTDTVCLSLVYREGEEAAFLEAVRERFNAALRPEVGPRRFAEF